MTGRRALPSGGSRTGATRSSSRRSASPCRSRISTGILGSARRGLSEMSGLAHSDDKMTVEEFLAFAATRPDEEKWELIEGEPIMNAAPAYLHQRIVRNLIIALGSRETKGNWAVIPGIGV